jgi:hypothetical protein
MPRLPQRLTFNDADLSNLRESGLTNETIFANQLKSDDLGIVSNDGGCASPLDQRNTINHLDRR